MKNILKTTVLILLMATTMGCETMLKSIGSKSDFDLKTRQSFVIGDLQGVEIQKSINSNYNASIDYLAKNQEVRIVNHSFKKLIVHKQFNGKEEELKIAAKKSITITLTKGCIFTINDVHSNPFYMSVKYPIGYTYYYKILTL